LDVPRVELHLLQVGRCRHPEWVTIRGGRWRAVDFPSLVALIRHPRFGALLYDTGYADHFETATAPFPERFYRWLTPVHLPPEERLAAQLARHGLRSEDVQRVMISHFHADHVAGLRDLPRATFMALEADYARQLGGGQSVWRMLRHGVLPALLPADFGSRLALADGRPVVDLGSAWKPFDRGYDLLGDRSLIGIPLPGHSPAQLGVLLRDQRDRLVLLAADACWSSRAWREQRMPSILARPIFDDWHAYRRTLGGLLQIAQRHPDLEIIPSHEIPSHAQRSALR
jgi:glyoxylase-like metal-dependent hydrolase (beta-lactamase superfamily II)